MDWQAAAAAKGAPPRRPHQPRAPSWHGRAGRNLHAPGVALGIEIVQISEGAPEEEVLPDVAEWPLDLAFRLGPIRLTSARRAIVMGQQQDQGCVVGDNTVGALANHGRLHPVIENLFRRTPMAVKAATWQRITV